MSSIMTTKRARLVLITQYSGSVYRFIFHNSIYIIALKVFFTCFETLLLTIRKSKKFMKKIKKNAQFLTGKVGIWET